MRTLLFTHCEPGLHQHPFPVLDDENEVVAGPRFKDVRHAAQVRYLHTPFGRFDAGAVLRAAGDWRPDLILVHADSTRHCFPGRLRELKIPTVLLVGDTHHLDEPLRSLLSYAVEERFDHVVVWNRQHAHYFHEAGIRGLHWLPGLLFWVPDFPRQEERKAQVGFFGSLGRFHPRRTALLSRLREAGIALEAGRRSRREGLRLLSGSAIGLNQSLNGEFNLRVMETLEAGALLLTDRLRPQTGLDTLFSPGRDYLDFGSSEEAVERAQWALAHRAEADAIAHSGQKRARELFSREARRRQLVDILTFGDRGGPFSLESEPRCRRRVLMPQDVTAFQERLIAYEFVQELHRLQSTVTIVGNRDACPELADDLADLSRLEWVSPGGTSAPEAGAGGDRIGVGRMDDPALAGCGDHFRYCPNGTGSGVVPGWRKLSPSIALYERLDQPYGEENFEGGWRLCWPGARKAIVTLAVGEKFCQRFEKYYLPSWRRYVARHRLDLVVLKAPLDNSLRAANRSPAWQKCLVGIHPFVAHYEQVAWVDADILIADAAPSIFDGVACEEIGAVEVSAIDEWQLGTTARVREWYRAEGIEIMPGETKADLYAQWGLPVTELGANAEKVVQTGCFVLSPALHGPLLVDVYRRYEDKGAANWNYEMWPLSFELVKRLRIRWLEWRFNACTGELFFMIRKDYRMLFRRQRSMPGAEDSATARDLDALFTTALQHAHFLHLAGMGEFVEMAPSRLWRDEPDKVDRASQ